ncbi:unnamed protein product, partial [Prorocentrum cordatum]
MPKRPRSKHLATRARRRRLQDAGAAASGSGPAAAAPEPDPGDPVPSHGAFGRMIDEAVGRFEAHYRLQKLVATEAEFEEQLRSCIRQPLPVAFRLCVGAGPGRAAARSELDELLAACGEGCTTARGRWVPAPRRFEFSDSVQLACDARTLRQEQREAPGSPLAAIASWLARHAGAAGVASRQEVASTLPVALLEVEPGHSVLDMCASPGSKTMQALERVHDRRGFLEASGMVVANELSADRGHVLARRCSSQGAACAHFAVTQYKAQVFPGPTSYFDRIICDVPCSGDGAIRKYPEKWKSWAPHHGRMLHSLQLQIAMRAAALLRTGGLLCYSTCSFNPLENEAVVASLLSRTGGALELVLQPSIPGLQTRPGLASWVVVDESLGSLGSYEEAMSRLRPAERRRYRRSMWPPESDRRLDRCVRLLPFLQNTGGFFVAVLRKRSDWPPPSPRAPPDASLGAAPRWRPPDSVEQLLEAVGGPLTAGQLLSWGERGAFACGSRLAAFAYAPRRRRLALVCAGVRVAERRARGELWRPTAAAAELLAAAAGGGRAPEANAAAARKLQGLHRCAGCGRERAGVCFSRKMLTRQPEKRRCAECVAPVGQGSTHG